MNFANFGLNSSLDSIFDVCDCRLNFLKLAVDKAGTRVVRNNWIKVFLENIFNLKEKLPETIRMHNRRILILALESFWVFGANVNNKKNNV